MTIIKHIESAQMVLALEPGEYDCEFVVYECIGTGEDGKPVLRAADGGCCDPCDTIEKARRYMHGAVKWDGCINWDMDSDGCMKHNCGMADAMSIADIFKDIYLTAAEHCEKWDGVCAGTEART